MFSLGTIGLLPVGIITLWALSPLAGQSSLRVLSIRNVTDANVAFPWAVQDSTDLSTIDPSRFLDLKSFYISAVALSQTPGFAMVGQRYVFSCVASCARSITESGETLDLYLMPIDVGC